MRSLLTRIINIPDACSWCGMWDKLVSSINPRDRKFCTEHCLEQARTTYTDKIGKDITDTWSVNTENGVNAFEKLNKRFEIVRILPYPY